MSIICAYLQYKYLPGGAIDVEFAIGRIVRIDALTGKKIHNILRSIFIAIGGGDLMASMSMADVNIKPLRHCHHWC